MTLPWPVWAALACGIVLIMWPKRWRAAWLDWCSAAVVWIAFLAVIAGEITVPTRDVHSLALPGMVLAVLWSVGFGRGITASASHPPASWGWMWLTVAGVAIVSCGQDWLTLGLAWEIVRRATAAMMQPAPSEARSPQFDALGPSLGLWTAIVAWLFATGSLNLEEIATILQRSYAAHDPEISIGRPALIMVAAACLTVISLLAPCFTTSLTESPENGDARVAGLCARQLAALLLLTRCCRDVFIGLEAPVSWVLLVLAAATWIVAVRTVAQPSRLDRLWIGCTYWQMAVTLTWLLIVLIARTSTPGGLPASDGLGFPAAAMTCELLHTLLVVAGSTAAVGLLARQHAPPLFLEDLQGAGRDHPVWAAMLLLPLASLIGVPVLFGGRLRFLLSVAMWSLPQAGPNDTLVLHGGLVALLAISLVAWVLLAGSCLSVFRTLLWDHPLTAWTLRHDLWSGLTAIAVAAALVLAGMCLQWWSH